MPLTSRRPQAFSKRERLALFVLIFLLILVEAAGFFSDDLFAPPRRDTSPILVFDTIRVYKETALNEPLESAVHRPVRDKRITSKTNSAPFTIALNETDTFAWEALPGIGPTYARRILKYRALLGGYAYKEQLGEVYGLDTSGRWFDQVLEDGAALDSLRLNQDTVTRFYRHPYVRPAIAWEWVRYRERTGGFKNLDEVRGGYLMTDSIFRKIAPYLALQ